MKALAHDMGRTKITQWKVAGSASAFALGRSRPAVDIREFKHERSHVARLPRRFEQRANCGLPRSCRSRHGCPRRAPLHSGASCSRSRRPLELQSREVRLLLSGSEWPSPPHLQNAHGRSPAGPAHHRAPHEILSPHQRPCHRRFLELSCQPQNPCIRTAAGRRLENLAARRGSRAGVSKVHRMFSLPGRMPRTSRTRQEGAIRRPALFRSSRRPRNASAGRPQPCRRC